MVAVLVGDHVALGERPALGAELVVQLVEEAEVEIDVLVGRAVERPDLGRRGAAAGLRSLPVNRIVSAGRYALADAGTRSSTPGCC